MDRQNIGRIGGTCISLSAICSYFGTGSFWIAGAVFLGLMGLGTVMHYYSSAK